MWEIMMTRRMLALTLAAILSLPVTCGVVQSYYEFHTKPKPDPSDPARFIRRTGKSAMAYEIADEYPALLAGLACYCGCADFISPHKNLLNCYVNPFGGYEEHASLCRICQGETFDARDWHEAGVPLDDVRRRIDEKWSNSTPEFGPNAPAHGE